MQNLDSLPVIIGIGEITDRPEKGQTGLEPLRLIERAAQLADQDAGGGWLSKVDQLYVVPQLTWPYPDLAGLVQQTLVPSAKAHPADEVSGDSPVRYLMRGAVAITRGDVEAVLLCGAEALQSVRTAAMQGRAPEGWTSLSRPPAMLDGSAYVTKLAARYGLKDPTEVYTLYENAMRAAAGLTAAQARDESAALWARYAKVAADNPYAWDRSAPSALEIAQLGPSNRPISYPYLKRMVAQMFVNQGAAVLLTQRKAALAAGIPEDRLVYVWSGAGAADVTDFLSRPRFDRSPAIAATLQHTLDLNGLEAKDLDALELYSCFPCIPKLGLSALGELREGVEPTVAGGLTFFGGPLGNYMSHAITAMVRRLRTGEGSLGLLYGNGGYVTKHHAAVLARKPPSSAPQDLDIAPAIDAAREVAPTLLEHYFGPAVVESYLVKYNSSGAPALITVVARTPDGGRTLAKVPLTDLRAQALLIDGEHEPIGLSGHIEAGDPVQSWHFDEA